MRDFKDIELVNGRKNYCGIPNIYDGLAQIYAGEKCLRDPNRAKTLSGPL